MKGLIRFPRPAPAMRMLLLHCDRFEYEPVKREIGSAVEDPGGPGSMEDVLAALVSVEKGDGPAEASEAAGQIRAHLGKIGCARVMLYPYAHLSGSLADPASALRVLGDVEGGLGGLEVSVSPFGWTKSYRASVKGHPLAESFRQITGADPAGTGQAEPAREPQVTSSWKVIEPDGSMTDADSFDFAGHEKLRMLARYEESGSRAAGEAPPHVNLMKKLGIADYEPASDPGNMRFFPAGRLVKSLIESYVTERVRRYGGCEVETPIMYDPAHPGMAAYFGRFPARQYSVDSDGRGLFLRFAACFGQFMMAARYQLSHRGLPFRLYELTRYSFRREQSGELVGLRRLRAFTMPDCHAFCRDMPQAVSELEERFALSRDVLGGLGIKPDDYEMAIRMTEEFYRENRAAVERLVRLHGRPALVEMWSEKFFYFVLKWEFNYVDPAGKASALSTDQIDVENAARYGITYIDEANETRHPVILHNSPSGAVERVIYALLEKAAAESARGTKPSLPLWLAPTQVRLVPLKPEFYGFCDGVASSLAAAGVRADVDDRDESVARRVRDAEKEWIRYVVVAGPREAESGNLSVRERGRKDPIETTADGLAGLVRGQVEGMPGAPLNLPRDLSRRPRLMV